MNILVFGWYHHRNAGDDRIQYCITRWLDGHTLAFLPSGRRPPIHLMRTYDAVIIGGGGLIMARGGMFADMARWIRAAGIPVALVGASIERISPPLRQELRSFLDVCTFAWFRDQGSLDEVGPHPKAFVAPDITWLYPYPLQESTGDGVAVCLRKSGNLLIADWRRSLAALGSQTYAWPLYFEQGGDAAVLQEALPGQVVSDEFSLAPLAEANTVISGRFHGLLFGMQTGRPVLTVSSLPKTTRFLSEHGLAEWQISESEPEKLVETHAQMKENHARLLERVYEVRAHLHAAAIQQAESAKQQLLQAASELPRPSRRWKNRVRNLLDLGSYF